MGRTAPDASRDGKPEIYVMNADGSNPTRLTDSPDREVIPAWSPDGTRIAYVTRIGEGNWDIYVMDADGSGTVRLTIDGFEAGVHSSSPDWASGSVPTGLVAAPLPTTSAPEPAPKTTATGLYLVGTALTEPLESSLAGVWVNGSYTYVGSQSISYERGGFKTGIRNAEIGDQSAPFILERTAGESES